MMLSSLTNETIHGLTNSGATQCVIILPLLSAGSGGQPGAGHPDREAVHPAGGAA